MASVGLLRETRLRSRLTRPRSFLLVCPSRGPGFRKSKFRVSFDNRAGWGFRGNVPVCPSSPARQARSRPHHLSSSGSPGRLLSKDQAASRLNHQRGASRLPGKRPMRLKLIGAPIRLWRVAARGRQAMIALGLAIFIALLTMPEGRAQTPSPSPPPAATQPPSVKTLHDWRRNMAQVPLPKKGCFTASYPNNQWQEVPCTTAPARPYPPTHGRKERGRT